MNIRKKTLFVEILKPPPCIMNMNFQNILVFVNIMYSYIHTKIKKV